MNIRQSIPLGIKKILRPIIVYRRHRGLLENDIFLASYPKSGNTWLKFMISTLFVDKDIGFDEAEELLPFVGNHTEKRLLPDGRRVIKTHEPYRTEYKKAIYIVRDGRDVAISYFHHHKREGTFAGNLEEFVDAFLKGNVDGLPAWHKHVMGWLDHHEDSDILVVKYEDCLMSPTAVIKKILNFMEISVEHEKIEHAVAANTKDKMREKEKISKTALGVYDEKNHFVRKGKNGEWKEVFDDRLNEIFIQEAGEALRLLGYEV